MINFNLQYSEMRKSLIEIIFNNADMINPNLNDFIGYINAIDYDGTLGDDIPREYKDPIIVTKIENNEVYGYPAVDGSGSMCRFHRRRHEGIENYFAV